MTRIQNPMPTRMLSCVQTQIQAWARTGMHGWMRARRPAGWAPWLCALVWAIAGIPATTLAQPPAAAGTPSDRIVVDAREAAARRDRARLAELRTAAAGHPLAMWVDYWELAQRLDRATQTDLDAFYAKWPGTYVEDRLRNDWLLELGRRRDWANFRRDVTSFRMNDDRQVHCYRLLTEHLDGRDVRDAALAAWYAQREPDEGCQLLAATLHEAGKLQPHEIWIEARLSVEANRPAGARRAAAMLGKATERAVDELLDRPQHALRQLRGRGVTLARAERAVLALARLAATDVDAAAGELSAVWAGQLPAEHAAWAWAAVGRQAAMRQQPEASAHYARAFRALGRRAPDWSDDTLAWAVRAALRWPAPGTDRWDLVLRATAGMSAAAQRESSWVYWRARALQARAGKAPRDGSAGGEDAGRRLLEGLAGRLDFYGLLATEDLGRTITMPPAPAASSDAEMLAARSEPGLARALQLIALGLRPEGVREWNWTLRGRGDRELLAAAQLGCERQVWDRCIHASERAQTEVDVARRYPMPHRDEALPMAREIGLDPAFVYGLKRQESRFIADARSHVGAAGLMQLMPATAKWMARRLGMRYDAAQIADPQVNLRLGMSYLKTVLDAFEGREALAAAAYNAGPSRPRRWRHGPPVEAAAWAESIPFTETREYVKKVLANAVVYAALMGSEPPSLRSRLGPPVGPRDAREPAEDRDIP